MSKTITITAGHSNSDPGAVNGIHREADIVTDMRNMVRHYLQEAGVNVRTDGESKINQSLSAAIKLIKGSAIAVEFHCNAAANKTAQGVEALAQPKDKAIAQKLCQAVAAVMGNPLRGDKGYKPENSGQHSRLGYVRNGGVILEPFFISNEAELKTWYAKKWLVARAVADVLIAEARA